MNNEKHSPIDKPVAMPTYKVISNYPGNNDFPINKIIELVPWRSSNLYWAYYTEDCQGERMWLQEFFDKYPNIFQPIDKQPDNIKTKNMNTDHGLPYHYFTNEQPEPEFKIIMDQLNNDSEATDEFLKSQGYNPDEIAKRGEEIANEARNKHLAAKKEQPEPVKDEGKISHIKELPEVATLDGEINKLVHNTTPYSPKVLQEYFWRAIDAIQKQFYSLSQPEPVKDEGSYPGKSYQRLFNAINDAAPNPIQSQMQDIIHIVREDFPAEPDSKDEETLSDIVDKIIYVVIEKDINKDKYAEIKAEVSKILKRCSGQQGRIRSLK